jgi:competence protein ComEC
MVQLSQPALLPAQSQTCYQPLVYVALAVATGVVVDRQLEGPLFAWPVIFAFTAALWWLTYRNRQATASLISLLAAIACLSATWHNVRWNPVSADGIVRHADLVARPVFLYGFVDRNPVWVAAENSKTVAGKMGGTRTRFTLSVTRIRDGDTLLPVSGRVEVFVNGRLEGVVAGDRVSVVGNISRICHPGNPGQFNFADYFRGQAIRCWMNVDHVESITVLDRPFRGAETAGGRIKAALDGLIRNYVSPGRAPLASAMLLGNRDQLDQGSREQFMVTGTVHLLAISGLHVGILASLFLVLPATGLVSRRAGLLLTVTFVVCYAWLVEFRPPVVRAAILICVYCYCKWSGRKAFSFNSLALAALIVIVRNPSDLFSSGAQLSFLAVASLIFGRRWMEWPASTDPVDQLLARSSPWYIRSARLVLEKLYTTMMVSTVIWMFAFPLVASRFHVVAPVALIVNPLVLLPVTVALLGGFLVLVFGSWLPVVASMAGSICDGSLHALQTTIEAAEAVPGGHFWTAGPPMVALAIFYSVLAVMFVTRPAGISFKVALTGLAAWLVIACWIPSSVTTLQAKYRKTLECTFVDVGHGSCVLLELPGGRNVLYDCGSIGSSRNAARNAAGVLWSRNVSRLDAVIISHADADHFNGLPVLARQFAMGRLIVSAKMMSRRNRPDVKWLMSAMDRHRLLAETVTAGDSLTIADGVSIRIISPAGDLESQTDNEESIVLEIEYAGRKILLTADVEGRPLARIMNEEKSSACDLAMVPHHGSPNSRPAAFLDWANPKIAVVCSRRSVNEDLERFLGTHQRSRTTVFHTGRDGAIRYIIQPSGEVMSGSYRDDPW